MSAMERTTYRRSLGSNALAFDEPRRDPQHAPYTSAPSTDFSSTIPFHCFCPIPRISLVRGNLRLCGKPADKHPNAGVVDWWFRRSRSWSRYLIPMSRASLSTKQRHPWAARPRINQRRRPPR